jgi:hypothetical protein
MECGAIDAFRDLVNGDWFDASVCNHGGDTGALYLESEYIFSQILGYIVLLPYRLYYIGCQCHITSIFSSSSQTGSPD